MLLKFFFTHYAWKAIHMGCTKFKRESKGDYCEFVKLWKQGSVVISAQYIVNNSMEY